MHPKHVVLSLPVADPSASLTFYRDIVSLELDTPMDGVLATELPGLSLFLVDRPRFESFSGLADSTAGLSTSRSECLLSCAIESRHEVDDTLARIRSAGGAAYGPTTRQLFGHEQYVGYFKDPDGHLWELVHNLS
jgi:predicted lactoylglutathione lyase